MTVIFGFVKFLNGLMVYNVISYHLFRHETEFMEIDFRGLYKKAISLRHAFMEGKTHSDVLRLVHYIQYNIYIHIGTYYTGRLKVH